VSLGLREEEGLGISGGLPIATSQWKTKSAPFRTLTRRYPREQLFKNGSQNIKNRSEPFSRPLYSFIDWQQD
jgi:hypothetical protein